MGYQLRFIEKYDIEAMARAVYSAGIHLADERKEWLQLMMSMAGGGERLLDSFLLLASMAGRKFKERENRREFLKAVPKSCDTGLFFFRGDPGAKFAVVNAGGGFAYVGIASATVKAGLPVPVVMSGVINETAMLDNMKEMFPSGMETPTALAVPSALKTACPHLIFMSDEANDVPSNS